MKFRVEVLTTIVDEYECDGETAEEAKEKVNKLVEGKVPSESQYQLPGHSFGEIEEVEE